MAVITSGKERKPDNACLLMWEHTTQRSPPPIKSEFDSPQILEQTCKKCKGSGTYYTTHEGIWNQQNPEISRFPRWINCKISTEEWERGHTQASQPTARDCSGFNLISTKPKKLWDKLKYVHWWVLMGLRNYFYFDIVTIKRKALL